MPDADPNRAYVDARTSLKDTAKWIVTIAGSTIVLVIGGGLIAKIGDLDWIPRLIAAASLLFLTMVCLVPLRAAIDIIAAKIATFELIAISPQYRQARATVDGWMRDYFPKPIDTVRGLYDEYLKQVTIANDNHAHEQDREKARKAVAELQPRVRDIIELSNTEFLRLKFDWMVTTTTFTLPFIGASLFIFLVTIHRDDQIEKQLAKPILLQIPWNGGVEAAMKKAGMEEKCYVTSRPKLLQLSEKSGLRAGVVAIPQDLGAGCEAVRVIVTNSDEVYPDK